MTARVVLVRSPRDAQRGGGCCSADVRPFDEGGSHGHAPPRDGTAAVYLALRERLPAEVAVEVTSPSNWLWLVPALARDGRRRGLHGRALGRSVLAGLASPALVVDGRVLSSGTLPEPAEAVAAAEAELARPRRSGAVPAAPLGRAAAAPVLPEPDPPAVPRRHGRASRTMFSGARSRATRRTDR